MEGAEQARRQISHAEVARLADELGVPADAALLAYDAEVARLTAHARIHGFVSVLALNQVRRALKHEGH